MTFDDNAKVSGGRVSKRGRNVGIGVGGGLGVIAVFLISQFLGVDLSGLVGGAGGGSVTEEPIANCDSGADANADIECRMEAAAENLDAFWTVQAPSLGVEYTLPGFSLFTDSTTTGCGTATSAVGPFYCPPDQSVYLDTAFYTDLRDRFGASGGSLAQMYVVAHEFGHHIQNLTGVLSRSQDGSTGPASSSVRTELQADCYAGAWVAGASTPQPGEDAPLLKPVTPAEIADALDAASAVGDDRIQQASGGSVNPEAWTHGSSEQRQKWFTTGYDDGVAACDTFAASASGL